MMNDRESLKSWFPILMPPCQSFSVIVNSLIWPASNRAVGWCCSNRAKNFRAKPFCLCNGSYFLAAGRFDQLSILYSEEVELLLLLRWTEWLRRSPFLLCRLLLSFAGRPCITPLRASIPPLTEKLRQTMKALIAAFSWANASDS